MEDLMGNDAVSTEVQGGNESLQTEMIGDFFDYDDGLGAVVNQDGDPFTKEDGKYYQSIDEYQSYLDQQSRPAQSQQSKQPVQPAKNVNTIKQAQPMQGNVQRNGFDSFYKKDNGFDVNSVLSEAPKFNEFTYKRQNNPIIQDGQNGIQQQVQPKVDPKTADANTLREYREGLENSALKPIERAYNNSVAYYQQQGLQMPQEVFQSFNAEYTQLKEAIDEAVSSKKDELFENRFKEQREQSNFEDIEKKSIQNFSTVSSQYFPSLSAEQSEAKLSKLIFGYTDNTGKFVRGYGADIVDHAFDLANNGKTFQSREEWSNAYNKWWSNYASDPQNIAYIAQRAWDRFIASSVNNMRDSFRSKWDEEQREKLKQVQNNPYATRGGNLGQEDNTQAQIDNYFRPPSRNM